MEGWSTHQLYTAALNPPSRPPLPPIASRSPTPRPLPPPPLLAFPRPPPPSVSRFPSTLPRLHPRLARSRGACLDYRSSIDSSLRLRVCWDARAKLKLRLWKDEDGMVDEKRNGGKERSKDNQCLIFNKHSLTWKDVRDKNNLLTIY